MEPCTSSFMLSLSRTSASLSGRGVCFESLLSTSAGFILDEASAQRAPLKHYTPCSREGGKIRALSPF